MFFLKKRGLVQCLFTPLILTFSMLTEGCSICNVALGLFAVSLTFAQNNLGKDRWVSSAFSTWKHSFSLQNG